MSSGKQKEGTPTAGTPNSEINVTPLVDVMLVLLLIFMVVTPMLQKGPAVKLPMTTEPPKKPEDKNQILIAIQADKNIWLDKEKMTEAAFSAKIQEAYERNAKATVVIKGDARLTYGDVKKMMQKVKDTGFQEVGLIAEKEQRQK